MWSHHKRNQEVDQVSGGDHLIQGGCSGNLCGGGGRERVCGQNSARAIYRGFVEAMEGDGVA